MLKPRHRHGEFEQIALACIRIEVQEPLRVFEWQRTQEKIVDKTEDRSIQADPERESDDSNDSKSGRFAELSQRETDFVHDCSQLERFFIILRAAR
jgi:hypothetical protein